MEKENKWSIDQTHSDITFKIRHLMISNVKGTFKTYDASIYTTGKDFATAEIDLVIDAASVETGNQQRDEHLRSIDFLDVEDFKQIRFTSSTIAKINDQGDHELWGELTMKGITKNVKLNVSFGGVRSDPWGNEKAGFAVIGKINRSDWGLVWNTAIEAGGFMVGNEITIMCEMELKNERQKDLPMVLETTSEMATS